MSKNLCKNFRKFSQHTKVKKITLNLKEVICPFVSYKSKIIKCLNVIENYINKKTSIETILKGLIDMEKMKGILFSQNEIHALNLISLSLNNFKGNEIINEPWINNIHSLYSFSQQDVDNLVHEFEKERISNIGKRIANLLST